MRSLTPDSGAYTAMAVASLTNVLTDELIARTPEWIAKCQTYEGGLGGEPGLEAHGGYAFCGAAALAITGQLGQLRLGAMLRWLASCQKRLEGGFHGRTNKLVDGCYSFWQGATFAVIARALEMGADDDGIRSAEAGAAAERGLLAALEEADGAWLYDQGALQDYLMVCGQLSKGGLRDKPGKEPDYYHTCYCLAGLAVAQHSHMPGQPEERTQHLPYGEATALVRARARAPRAAPTPSWLTWRPNPLRRRAQARIDPRYNIVEAKVLRAQRFFAQLPPVEEPAPRGP